MAYGHGKDAALSVTGVGHANNSTYITAYLTSVDWSQSGDTAEVSTLGDAAKEYIAGMTDATASLEGVFDPAAGTLLATLVGGTAAPFAYYPQGTASGKTKFSGSWICTGYSNPSSRDDAVTFGAEFQVTGAVTIGTA